MKYGQGLADPAGIETARLDAVKAAGDTLLNTDLHQFSPQIVTGVVFRAESRITPNTWPKHSFGAVDVFMCGNSDP